MIQNQRAIYADIDPTDDKLQLSTGTTLIEDTEESGWVLVTSTGDVDQYMSVGPNNELYLNNINANGVIAFFLYPDEEVDENARTLEIGAHRKSDSSTADNAPVSLVYGSTAEAIVDGTYSYTIDSGTEQYYEIDVSKLVKDETSNRYLVMIGTNDANFTTLALTNIKVSGYQLGYGGADSVSAVSEGTADSDPVLTQVKTIKTRLIAVSQTEEPEEPAATEPAATEPAETEPAATEPAATEPVATEPAATEPAATEPAATEPAATEPVPKETEPEVPTFNENLQIQSATLRTAKVFSGKSAAVAVKAGGEAVTVAVFDSDGNQVELTKVTSKLSNGVMTFQAMWTVTGTAGDTLTYTVVVYDADGLASANTLDVVVTIR